MLTGCVMADFTTAQKKVVELKNKLRLITNRFGDMSPINSDLLPSVQQGGAVVVSRNVQMQLKKIQEFTTREKKEVPFLLYGKKDGGLVYFDKIFMDFTKSRSMEADFSRLESNLLDFIGKSKKDGTDIVAHGHSHPEIGDFYKYFSLGDMEGYKSMLYDNEVFNSGKIRLCSCLLTGGDYNFLSFDGNDYYKFNDVFVQEEDGEISQKLPCYNHNIVRNRTFVR